MFPTLKTKNKNFGQKNCTAANKQTREFWLSIKKLLIRQPSYQSIIDERFGSSILDNKKE
jgi:hypothetical protein